MKTRLAVLAVAGLALGGCYYPYAYGDPYVANSALVGAGLGAAAGAVIASSGPYYAPRPYYYAPRSYGYGYGPRYGYYRGW